MLLPIALLFLALCRQYAEASFNLFGSQGAGDVDKSFKPLGSIEKLFHKNVNNNQNMCNVMNIASDVSPPAADCWKACSKITKNCIVPALGGGDGVHGNSALGTLACTLLISDNDDANDCASCSRNTNFLTSDMEDSMRNHPDAKVFNYSPRNMNNMVNNCILPLMGLCGGIPGLFHKKPTSIPDCGPIQYHRPPKPGFTPCISCQHPMLTPKPTTYTVTQSAQTVTVSESIVSTITKQEIETITKEHYLTITKPYVVTVTKQGHVEYHTSTFTQLVPQYVPQPYPIYVPPRPRPRPPRPSTLYGVTVVSKPGQPGAVTISKVVPGKTVHRYKTVTKEHGTTGLVIVTAQHPKEGYPPGWYGPGGPGGPPGPPGQNGQWGSGGGQGGPGGQWGPGGGQGGQWGPGWGPGQPGFGFVPSAPIRPIWGPGAPNWSPGTPCPPGFVTASWGENHGFSMWGPGAPGYYEGAPCQRGFICPFNDGHIPNDGFKIWGPGFPDYDGGHVPPGYYWMLDPPFNFYGPHCYPIWREGAPGFASHKQPPPGFVLPGHEGPGGQPCSCERNHRYSA